MSYSSIYRGRKPKILHSHLDFDAKSKSLRENGGHVITLRGLVPIQSYGSVPIRKIAKMAIVDSFLWLDSWLASCCQTFFTTISLFLGLNDGYVEE